MKLIKLVAVSCLWMSTAYADDVNEIMDAEDLNELLKILIECRRLGGGTGLVAQPGGSYRRTWQPG